MEGRAGQEGSEGRLMWGCVLLWAMEASRKAGWSLVLAMNEGAREEASRSSRGPGTRVAERCDAFSCHKWVISHQSVPLPLQQVLHDCC